MTNEELVQKMKLFIAEQDTRRDEWYTSDQTAYACALEDFVRFMGIGEVDLMPPETK